MGKIRYHKIIRWSNILRLELKILWKYRESISHINDVIRLGEKVLSAPSIVWNENDDFSKIVIIFISQNMHRMQSIKILCKKGFARDSVGLLRVMFENLVDFKNIHQNKTLIKKYLGYDIYLRLKIARQFEDGNYCADDLLKVEKVIERLETQWNEIKSDYTYTDKSSRKRIFTRWTGKNSMQKLSDDVGLGRVYKQIWGLFSNYSHGSTIVAGSYIMGIENEKVVMELGTSHEFIENSIFTATANFIDMLSIANEEYNLGLEKDIENMSVKHKKCIASRKD